MSQHLAGSVMAYGVWGSMWLAGACGGGVWERTGSAKGCCAAGVQVRCCQQHDMQLVVWSRGVWGLQLSGVCVKRGDWPPMFECACTWGARLATAWHGVYRRRLRRQVHAWSCTGVRSHSVGTATTSYLATWVPSTSRCDVCRRRGRGGRGRCGLLWFGIGTFCIEGKARPLSACSLLGYASKWHPPPTSSPPSPPTPAPLQGVIDVLTS